MDAHDLPLPPLHPGFLLHRVLERYQIPQGELASALGVEPSNLSTVIHGRRPVTLHLARLLAMGLGTRPEFWLARQMAFDLAHAESLPPIALVHQLALLADSRPKLWLERQIALDLRQTQPASLTPPPPELSRPRSHRPTQLSRIDLGTRRPHRKTDGQTVPGRPAVSGRRPFESSS